MGGESKRSLRFLLKSHAGVEEPSDMCTILYEMEFWLGLRNESPSHHLIQEGGREQSKAEWKSDVSGTVLHGASWEKQSLQEHLPRAVCLYFCKGLGLIDPVLQVSKLRPSRISFVQGDPVSKWKDWIQTLVSLRPSCSSVWKPGWEVWRQGAI